MTVDRSMSANVGFNQSTIQSNEGAGLFSWTGAIDAAAGLLRYFLFKKFCQVKYKDLHKYVCVCPLILGAKSRVSHLRLIMHGKEKPQKESMHKTADNSGSPMLSPSLSWCSATA